MDAETVRILEWHVAAKDFAAADALCATLIAADENNAALWQMRGGLSATAKDWSAAESHFRRALALVPDAAKPWFGLARTYAGMGDLTLAGSAAEQALAFGLLPPDSAIAHAFVAEALFTAGNRDAGRARLASLVPYYKERCAPRTRESVLSAFSALTCAMSAGDVVFAEDLHRLLYPHATTIGPMAIASTSMLAEWCPAHGGVYEIVEDSREVTLAPTSPHGRGFTYRTGAIVRAVVPGGRYIPRFDFALTPDGTVLRDSGYMGLAATFNFLPHTFYAPANLLSHHAPLEIVDVDEDVLLLSAPPDKNFGHWLINFLPRLQGRGGLKVAMPAPLGGKQRDTLALCGVQADDIILCRAEAQYRFRNLHIFCPGRSMPPHPRNAAYLRQCFWGSRATRPKSGKRVFLARTSVGTRMIGNQAEFDATLAAEGFISADMANLFIGEQQELLADAEVLVGGMGTNLLALYFAPPGCTVIGIIDNPELDPLIAQTCAMVGMRCQYLISTPVGTSNRALHSRDVDFVVDCAAFRARLREL